jgi:hypothetical protein
MADQDVIAGSAVLNGIKGAITITPSGGTDLATGMNIESRNLSDEFTVDEIASQGGDIIETLVASKHKRNCRIRFIPKGTTKANAETVVDSFIALTKLQVVTVAVSTVSAYNGTFNFMGGMSIDETKEGRLVIEFNATQYQKTDGTFAALAVAT